MAATEAEYTRLQAATRRADRRRARLGLPRSALRARGCAAARGSRLALAASALAPRTRGAPRGESRRDRRGTRRAGR